MNQLLSPKELSVDDSSFLDMDYFVKTLSGIRAKGIHPDLIGSIITHYASMWLPDLSVVTEPCEKLASSPNKSQFYPCDEYDSSGSSSARWTRKRMCVEALVGVLPPERGSVTCDFLLRLLRVGSMVGADLACRAELERRVTWQLEEASLKELMIPSFSYTCGTLLDVGLVLRLIKGFINLDEAVRSGAALVKVAKLVDCYLAEAAIDSNLSSSEFGALAKALPGHARSIDDGLYRAIDTYFKAHPGVSKQERKALSRIIDSRKLSHEAALHAIQNERLPVRSVIHIIFSEQTKLHCRLDWSGSLNSIRSPSYLDPELTARCHSKREITQQTEMMKLRNDVVMLETRCATMQVQIEKMLEKKAYSKWKKIGMAVIKSVGGGGGTSEVEGEFGGRTPMVVVKPKSAKGRTPNKWRRSVS